MDYVGIDVHKRESQICILTDEGELIERRIRTPRWTVSFAVVVGEQRLDKLLQAADIASRFCVRTWRA